MISYHLFSKLLNHPELSLDIVVTGAHLSENYGLTLSIIDDDGFNIVDKLSCLIPILIHRVLKDLVYRYKV